MVMVAGMGRIRGMERNITRIDLAQPDERFGYDRTFSHRGVKITTAPNWTLIINSRSTRDGASPNKFLVR